MQICVSMMILIAAVPFGMLMADGQTLLNETWSSGLQTDSTAVVIGYFTETAPICAASVELAFAWVNRTLSGKNRHFTITTACGVTFVWFSLSRTARTKK